MGYRSDSIEISRDMGPLRPKDCKKSRYSSGIEIFKREWNLQTGMKISSKPHSKAARALVVGDSWGPDWKFQARMNISSD